MWIYAALVRGAGVTSVLWPRNGLDMFTEEWQKMCDLVGFFFFFLIFILSKTSRPSLGPVEPSIHWMFGALQAGLKRPGMKVAVHHHLVPRFRRNGAMPPLPIMSLQRAEWQLYGGYGSLAGVWRWPSLLGLHGLLWGELFFGGGETAVKYSHFNFMATVTSPM